MTTDTYRLVTELVRPGDHFDVPAGVQPVVEASQRPGFVRITYPKQMRAVPFEDASSVTFG
ncbi:Uncharacterized protein HSRCO_0695 [Halanaeroarchaeum sp. HSR-CO]|uniref:hypothetical protein n=1 Tax=Halanaeroarchaeum sp. HSR-CO TaxID=2866382 RepID=UPI00217EAB6E|nr:hypothetical protein [Halanaeroarchaeum sp. HSR-CO]UWG46990.1 Uncharacterized protein HSRCO_0695 [Halanaeroarchaeum sp. HSR-CO]